MSTPSTPLKRARLAVRLTDAQSELIRDAAAASGTTVTDFVTTAALEQAETALADRRRFELDDSSWEEFTRLLDRPARPVPELAALLRQPAVWETSVAPAPSAPVRR